MRAVLIGDTEVSTDGQKVWVNARGFCVARLCRVSMEVFSCTPGTGQTFLAHEPTGPDTWEHFRKAVLDFHGVEVPIDFAPEWVTAPVIGD